MTPDDAAGRLFRAATACGAWSAPDALEPVRRVREHRPEVPITMIEGAGHWAPHEQPEQVIRWLRGVLDAQPGGAIP